jgi:hypothetical protein
LRNIVSRRFSPGKTVSFTLEKSVDIGSYEKRRAAPIDSWCRAGSTALSSHTPAASRLFPGSGKKGMLVPEIRH